MNFGQAGAGLSFMAVSTSNDQTSAAEKTAQNNALSALLSVLLSAGYFRARVTALLPFDKVVGGLAWCITSSGAALDADIFFDDELGLGQKIQLAETIVKVLRTMSCPHPLQAHQIQGGDYVAIFPIIRWLVTKVLEYRRITGDAVRGSSESAFDKQYVPFAAAVGPAATASPAALSSVLKGGLSALEGSRSSSGDAYAVEVAARYKPARRYRRAGAGRTVLSGEARAQSVLLEFGDRTTVRVAALGEGGEEEAQGTGPGKGLAGRGGEGAAAQASDWDRKMVAMQKAARAEEEEKRKAAVALEASMMSQMTSIEGSGMSGSNVGALVGLQADELRRAAEEYRVKEEELRALAESGDLLANTRHGRAAAHGRRLGVLGKKVEDRDVAVGAARERVAGVEASLRALRDSLSKADRYNGRASAELAKLEASIAALPSAQGAAVHALYELFTRAEGLKEQEAKFKAHARAQMAQLQATLASLQSETGEGSLAGGVDLAALEKSHADAQTRLAAGRAALAVKCREVARLGRALDDIPSRPELVQYERTFLDMFDSVAEKLDETRRYYTAYNTAEKKRAWAAKEVSLLTSILEGFAPSMASDKGRKAYAEQVEGILRGLEESLVKSKASAEAKAGARDTSAATVQALVEAQRAYYRAVKDLQDEADRNGRLVAALQAAGVTS